jgi:hypothetical protein
MVFLPDVVLVLGLLDELAEELRVGFWVVVVADLIRRVRYGNLRKIKWDFNGGVHIIK